MMVLLSLTLFSIALVTVFAVMAATLVPAMPRIVALFVTSQPAVRSVSARPVVRRRPVMAAARPQVLRAAA